MVIIDSIVYDSYIDMCKDYNIDCKEFFEYKRKNLKLSEWDILEHFIPDLGIRLDTRTYVTRKKNCKE